MSILFRWSSHGSGGSALAEPDAEPEVPSRLVFPRGAFASLITDPPEAADEAYAAFVRHELTPTIAEREITHILAGCGIDCEALERQKMFRFHFDQETADTGRLRVIVHYLVQMQNAHESNMRLLRMFGRSGNVRRVTLMPGCCPVCDELANRRYRLSGVPDLPVDGCERHGGCICAWVPAID